MRALLLAGVVALASAGGCAIVYGYGDYEDQPVTGGTCDSPDDCLGEDTECGFVVCEQGRCGFAKLKEDNTPLDMQRDGDCKEAICIGGRVGERVLETDVRVDGFECTKDGCTPDGAPVNPPEENTKTCGVNGALTCDGQGNCVGCSTDAQCGTPPPCYSATCNGVTCVFGFADGAPCAPGYCNGDSEVPSATCSGGMCVEPAPTPCSPYTCDGTACLETCTDDSQCADSTQCLNGTTCIECTSCDEWYETPTIAPESFCLASQNNVDTLIACACVTCATTCSMWAYCDEVAISVAPECTDCILLNCSNELADCYMDDGHPP